MNIEFQNATPDDNLALDRMFQFFAHDLSELSGMDIGDDGFYHGLNDLEDYTSKQNYKTHFIKVDEKLAGVVVIRFDEGINYLRHYFILRKFRKKQIGMQAAMMAFDLYPGDWRVSTMDYNVPAIKFWEKVLETYAKDKFSSMRRDDDKGPQYEFYLKDLLAD